MTKLTEKEIQGILPNLKGLPGLDPRAETRIEQAFRRIYEIMNFKLEEQRKSFESKLSSTISDLQSKQNQLTGLIGSLSQPLVGSSTPEIVLQSVISSYGPQSPNHFLAGPVPSFRAITQADLPAIIASQLNANGDILDIDTLIAGEYLRRIGNTIISGVPVGTTNLAEGTLPNAEGILYQTPINFRTKIINVLLFNNSAGALVANILAKDDMGILIPGTNLNFNLASMEKVIVNLNLILTENYTFRGYTSAIGAIEHTIFGIQEPLT